MRPFCLFVALLGSAAVTASAAHAQWTVSLEIGADRYWGGAVDSTPEGLSLRPYRPTTVGAGVERRTGRWGIGLRLRYAEASLALEGADAVTAVKGVFTVYSAAPEASYRVSRLGAGSRLVIHGGPLLEAWSVTDEGSETRIGVQAAFSLEVPLGGRVSGALSAGAAVISSPFADDQLDPAFERRALWRRRVAAALEYGL
jgi:hypothetical protein